MGSELLTSGKAALGQRFFDEGAERVHIGNGQFAQHLTVDLHSLGGQAMNELAVLAVALSTCAGDSDNPESAEIALLRTAVSEGILPRFHHLLVRAAEYVLFASPVTGRHFDDLFVALMAH